MNLLEKILASHAGKNSVRPGDIFDIEVDVRVARDFGGANVVKNIRESGLSIDDPQKTLFTFDCNPTGSDQKYAANQHYCRLFAREYGIRVFDIDAGIGTHLLIEKGYAVPGSVLVSTDSHANVLGAVGAFGQGMGDMDIAASWHSGRIWFKVPPSVKIYLTGLLPDKVTAKDIILNLLAKFGASTLLGYSVEMDGPVIENFDLDTRITISSMATEMGAIIILFPPSKKILDYCRRHAGRELEPVYADNDAIYEKTFNIDVSDFTTLISRPGEPHDTVPVSQLKGLKIDSAFIGSCTNGRMNDMRIVADILKNRKVAPGVVLKIVPSTSEIWDQSLKEGIIDLFRKSGALVSNAGCAGCAAGQVGQNGPGEITISTGNRNFAGKQGKGSVYLASPAIAAASAVAGYITEPDDIPENPALFVSDAKPVYKSSKIPGTHKVVSNELKGRARLIPKDNIDTDLIFHNRYLSITDIKEMGQYTFDNMTGYEDFAENTKPGDIVITGKNFGCGSSRQQAVDCFVSLGINAIVAGSFGAIYERNAINAAFPVISMKHIPFDEIHEGDQLRINLKTGTVEDLTTGKKYYADPFSEVQFKIYVKGGLLA